MNLNLIPYREEVNMSKQPNIVFILNDHQAYYRHGWDEGVKPKRPCFEEFAGEGIEFENAYCVTPMCGPARRSFLTGLYPHTHGQVHNENDPPYEHEVYLNTLSQAGYKNYYYGKWHAGPGCAYDHSCEGLSETGYGNPYSTKEYEEYLKRNNLPRAQHMIERVFRLDGYDIKGYFPKLKEGELYSCEDFWCGEHATGVTVTPKETHEAFFLADLACRKLEELKESEEPFSLRVDFWGPHQPFFPTQEFIDMYNPEEITQYKSFDSNLDNKPNVIKTELNRPIGDGEKIIHPNPIPWNEWKQILAKCYAHITMVDEAGGLIIKKIKELGLDENTIIIWTTDHGDSIACQGGHFDKGSHLAQEVMRIPMAMKWKNKIEPEQKSDKLVFTCDVPVTILDSANLSFKNRVDGRSLLDLAQNRDDGWRDSLMCESYGHGYGCTIISRMIVKNNIKYVCTENDMEELYNLEKDPYELNNLAINKEFDGLKKEMQNLLREHQRLSSDPVPLEKLI